MLGTGTLCLDWPPPVLRPALQGCIARMQRTRWSPCQIGSKGQHAPMTFNYQILFSSCSFFFFFLASNSGCLYRRLLFAQIPTNKTQQQSMHRYVPATAQSWPHGQRWKMAHYLLGASRHSPPATLQPQTTITTITVPVIRQSRRGPPSPWRHHTSTRLHSTQSLHVQKKKKKKKSTRSVIGRPLYILIP